MFGVFRESPKQAGERLGQQLTKARSNAHGKEGFAGKSKMSQFEGLIERHA
jgi:hypothetical protein